MKTKKRKIGDLGEGIACDYLKNKGFKIIEQNYWKPWGEIDIVAEKQGIIYFVEVKSVTRGTLNDVTHVTKQHNPADNIHPWKLKRLIRTIQSYILSRNMKGEWKFLALIVYLSIKDKTAKIELLENIVL